MLAHDLPDVRDVEAHPAKGAWLIPSIKLPINIPIRRRSVSLQRYKTCLHNTYLCYNSPYCVVTIPPMSKIFLPILKLLKDKKEHTIVDVTDKIAEQLELTSSERKMLTPIARRPKFDVTVR